jgi:hypothetical protein
MPDDEEPIEWDPEDWDDVDSVDADASTMDHTTEPRPVCPLCREEVNMDEEAPLYGAQQVWHDECASCPDDCGAEFTIHHWVGEEDKPARVRCLACMAYKEGKTP